MTMMPVHTESGRRELLKGLGLSPDAPGLAHIEPEGPAKEPKAKKAKKKKEPEAPSVDLRRIPASEIVFDPTMLDDFPDLSGSGMAAASRHLFELYKSPTKDRERNGLLHRRIGEFIQQVRRDRQALRPSTGTIKEKVKVTKAQRDLARLMADKGLTAEDLARLVQERA